MTSGAERRSGRAPRQGRLFGAVVTYRRPSELEAMLTAMERQTKQVTAMIVVDNANDALSREVAECHGARYVAADTNLGPAGGIALAMRQVLEEADEDDWLVLLDDDDPPHSDAILERLWDFAHAQRAADPRTAAVGELGGRYDPRLGIFRRVPDDEIIGAVSVDVIGGGHLPFYRCGDLASVGVFDPDLFFGFEEGEFGLRLRQAGRALYADSGAWWAWRAQASPDLLWATRTPHTKAAWRRYYSVRNVTLLAWRYGRPGTPWFVALGGAAKGTWALLRSGRPLDEVLLPVRGAVDGLLGRAGRPLNPASSVK